MHRRGAYYLANSQCDYYKEEGERMCLTEVFGVKLAVCSRSTALNSEIQQQSLSLLLLKS